MVVKQKETKASAHTKATPSGARFVCTASPAAKTVYLVGEFNDWNQESHRMVKRDGKFQKTLKLAPGEYQYRYVVDGEWHTDPDAEQVANPFGTTNNRIKV